jgi:predicted nucleic acid-binding protein
MEPLTIEGLPDGALLLMDTAPIVYFLEAHPKLAKLFRPLFRRHAAGEIQFAVTTISIAEVLTGPLQSGNEALTERLRTILESWRVLDLTVDIAERAARLRATVRLKLPDAIQAASAIAINADALITYDRDFSRVSSLCVLPQMKV